MNPTDQPISWIKRPFTLLALTLTIYLFFLFPFRDAQGVAGLVPRVLFTAILFSSLYAIVRRNHAGLTAAALMIPPLVLTWGDLFYFDDRYSIARLAAVTIFLLFVAGMVLSDVMRTERVTMDTISGGLAVYLLVGLMFTQIYTLLLGLDPNAIHFPSFEESNENADVAYYSFVTLTTLGYGDILPISKAARAMATLEAVVGQVYLTVLVARLVGLHISQTHRGDLD